MSQHTIWVLGWITLAPVGVGSVAIIYAAVVSQWRRIWSLACGNPEFIPPAASVASDTHRPRRHQPRAVEAGAELTRETIDG